jgi:uncharacterized membrane protein
MSARRFPSFLRRSRRDEGGAILVLASVGMVIAMISCALAIDIGSLAQDARQDQKVADMAALDAIRGTTATFTSLAQASAARNSFPTSTGYSLTAVEGSKSGNGCTAVSGLGSVCVTVTSPYKNKFPFVSGRTSVTRSAVASKTAFGGFMIGSSLVTIDTSRATLLNKFMGGILKGSDLSLSAVSWQGLAAGDVTLEAFRTALAGMGFSVGNVSQLMSANLTMNQLMQATASALTSEGGVANLALATQLTTLRATITNSTQFTLGQFMHVSQGADNAALASQLNVFQLITGSAQVANGNNFITINDVGVAVGNVLSTKVSLQVIQPPQFYFGPVGGSVSTSQIDVTVTPKLNLPVTVAGLASVTVTNDLPVRMSAAGAVGTLAAASCGVSPGITVTVDPTAFSGSASASLNARVALNILGIPVNIADITIPTTNVVPSTDGGAANLSFSFPTEFPPPNGTTTSKHTGSQPIGLSSLTNITAGTPTVTLLTLTPLPVPVGTIVSAVLSALSPVLSSVDNTIMTPLLQALGLDIGSADVTALALQCNTPVLSG